MQLQTSPEAAQGCGQVTQLPTQNARFVSRRNPQRTGSKDTHTPTLTAASFTSLKVGKKPKRPPVDG